MTFSIARAIVPVLLAVTLGACGGGGGGGGGGGSSIGAGAGNVAGLSPATDLAGAFGTTSSSSQAGGESTGAASSGGAAAAGSAGGTVGTGATASAGGDDGSGVGSGGTGVSSASAVGVGSADGFGSVIVNGVRYNTDNAQFSIDDAPELLLGMSVKVTGPTSGDFTSGTATRVESAADLRGTVSGINAGSGTFSVLGTTVSTDSETVWADAGGLSGIAAGGTVQVWGLPAAPGVLRATRVALVAATAPPVLTGTVQNLDSGARVFSIGPVSVSYASAAFLGGIEASSLANGSIVRVRGNSANGLAFTAASVQAWYPVPPVEGLRVNLDGVVTNFTALAGFRILGTPVDATTAQITGGPSAGIGNGVKLEVAGVLSGGRLIATKIKIRHVPGTGGPSSFTLIGTVGAFASPASFKVRGQPVDASGSGVVFGNGTAANLGNGAKVSVTGSQVLNGVLLADTVTFN